MGFYIILLLTGYQSWDFNLGIITSVGAQTYVDLNTHLIHQDQSQN